MPFFFFTIHLPHCFAVASLVVRGLLLCVLSLLSSREELRAQARDTARPADVL